MNERARGSSAIGGGLSNLREVEDELDADEEQDGINEKQINVKKFDLGVPG